MPSNLTIYRLAMPNYDYGISVGKIDVVFSKNIETGEISLSKIHEQNYPVNDRIEPDSTLINKITSTLNIKARKKGDLMFPAFTDIIFQEPKLEDYDETTKHGRMSKGLWEQFIANLLRNSAPAEISIVRKVPGFLPLIGKLHEREVRSWLWIEDEIILMDMKGRDIRRLLEADYRNNLVTSGVGFFSFRGRKFWTIMGRFLIDDSYYRLATTNVISIRCTKRIFQMGNES